MQVLEKDVERKFVTTMKRLGIQCLKMNLHGNRGYPDRQVLLPDGTPVFIEFKRPGEELRPRQKHIHEELKRLGYDVQVFDSAAEASLYIINKL